jgi:hypothetical protein
MSRRLFAKIILFRFKLAPLITRVLSFPTIMPVLGPSSSPPQSQHTVNSIPPQNDPMVRIMENTTSSSQITSKTDQNSAIKLTSTTTSCKIPHVTLDADIITDTMASRLAMSLLGHILFLKSQVPLYVKSTSHKFISH